MNPLRQALLGVLAAILSSAILIGSILLALTESGRQLARAVPPTPQPPVSTPRPGEPTYTASPTAEPSATPTLQAALECPPPPGWVQTEVLPSENMASIAQFYGISEQELRQNNCDYVGSTFPSPVILNVPANTVTPTSTATATSTVEPTRPRRPAATSAAAPRACGEPPGSWVDYIVQRGDTLYRIATSHGTTVPVLKYYNCLTSD
ncbi:MAG TPA: LysM domain-containing protein, partial [Anaerolineales bacterium]|nr:LysM domain-containing protein [Anaerolineales bacterium]